MDFQALLALDPGAGREVGEGLEGGGEFRAAVRIAAVVQRVDPDENILRADYFGRSAIGMILGLSFMIIVIGQVGGPMIAGIMADATGDYRAGFTILALLAGIGSFFFLLARRPSRPLRAPGG